METIIKGGMLMVFVNSKSIPLATSHTLRITGETNDTSNKDVASGKWKSSTIKSFSWEVTTDNLYSVNGITDMYDAFVAGAPLPIAFTQKTETEGTELPISGSWTPDTTTDDYFHGNAILTSLEVTAQNGENATFSATFEGVGELERGSN